MAPTAIETLTSVADAAPIVVGLKLALNAAPEGQPLPSPKKARPAFDALPLRPEHPYASAWGLYGDEDEAGTLNALGPELVCQGLSEIRTARVFSLALPLTVPRTPMNPARRPPKHDLICKGHANDDTVHHRTRDFILPGDTDSSLFCAPRQLTLNTQASSHWDGLRHYPYQQSGLWVLVITRRPLRLLMTHAPSSFYNGTTQASISRASSTQLGVQSE